jgi:hypothetical protein
MESERADGESIGMETPHEDNVVVEDLAMMNMSSPEQVKKGLVGATKYLHWVREKEAPVQKLVMQEEVSVHEEAPAQKEHMSDKDDPSDQDYLPSDDESSGEDEEVIQIRVELKELKKLKVGGMLVVHEERHEVNCGM